MWLCVCVCIDEPIYTLTRAPNMVSTRTVYSDDTSVKLPHKTEVN